MAIPDTHATPEMQAPVTCPRCGCTVIPVRDGSRWICRHCGTLIPEAAPED